LLDTIVRLKTRSVVDREFVVAAEVPGALHSLLVRFALPWHRLPSEHTCPPARPYEPLFVLRGSSIRRCRRIPSHGKRQTLPDRQAAPRRTPEVGHSQLRMCCRMLPGCIEALPVEYLDRRQHRLALGVVSESGGHPHSIGNGNLKLGQYPTGEPVVSDISPPNTS
jgi:hypothetical protein